jgi:hypothetical protein
MLVSTMRCGSHTTHVVSKPELNSKVKALVERTVRIVHSSIDSLRSRAVETVRCHVFT